jgi:hypothetical protein
VGVGRSGIGTTTGRWGSLARVAAALAAMGVAVASSSTFMARGRAGWVGRDARPGDSVVLRLRGAAGRPLAGGASLVVGGLTLFGDVFLVAVFGGFAFALLGRFFVAFAGAFLLVFFLVALFLEAFAADFLAAFFAAGLFVVFFVAIGKRHLIGIADSGNRGVLQLSMTYTNSMRGSHRPGGHRRGP